jgi:hypothetical protein
MIELNETVEDTRRRRTSGILLLRQAPDIVEAIARNAGSKPHLAGSAMRPICQGLDRFPKRAIPSYDVAG